MVDLHIARSSGIKSGGVVKNCVAHAQARVHLWPDLSGYATGDEAKIGYRIQVNREQYVFHPDGGLILQNLRLSMANEKLILVFFTWAITVSSNYLPHPLINTAHARVHYLNFAAEPPSFVYRHRHHHPSLFLPSPNGTHTRRQKVIQPPQATKRPSPLPPNVNWGLYIGWRVLLFCGGGIGCRGVSDCHRVIQIRRITNRGGFGVNLRWPRRVSRRRPTRPADRPAISLIGDKYWTVKCAFIGNCFHVA